MNASMARRIRNAEAVLISAIDRHTDGRRKSIGRCETAPAGQRKSCPSLVGWDEPGMAQSHQARASLYKATCPA
jgi:hypothetical protein